MSEEKLFGKVPIKWVPKLEQDVTVPVYGPSFRIEAPMTTLDQMAKAAYDKMVDLSCKRFSLLRGSQHAWGNQAEDSREDWRAAIEAALEVGQAVAESYFVKPEPPAEVKPDAVTQEHDPRYPVMYNNEWKPDTKCSSERGHFKRPDGKECYCGALIYNGNEISLRRRQ